MRRYPGSTIALIVAALSILFAAPTAKAADSIDITVVGGAGVVSDAVLAHLRTCTTGTVTRIAGPDRYATAAAVSRRSFAAADTVYVATGLNYPDALAAGPVAAANDAPILLVRTDSIPEETLSELDRLDPASIVVLGGTRAVSSGVETALRSRYPRTTLARIAGSDRYETAALISLGHFAPGVAAAYLAVGSNFPDALTGGAAAAHKSAPVLLTETAELPTPTI